jgi:O-succinylbenzoate synthase
MFRLERIVLREIRLPLKEPFRISSGVVTDRRICLLELFATDGTTGWSECVAGEQPNYSYETIDTAWHAIREWLAPRVLGRSFDSPDVVFATLERGVCGHNMAKAAIEMGYWYVAARRAGLPLSKLLGGTRAIASRLESRSAFRRPQGSLSALARHTSRAIERSR